MILSMLAVFALKSVVGVCIVRCVLRTVDEHARLDPVVARKPVSKHACL